MSGAEMWAVLAVILFVFAALTDLFDGMAARALKVDSKFGRMLDPIADKALVGLPLIAIAIVAWEANWSTWLVISIATGVIVGRDLLITVLRLLASDGEGARVSQLAKWKTAVELIAVGVPIVLAAMPAIMRLSGLGGFGVGPEAILAWTGLLALAALLSAVTAAQYLTAK
jgi:CDP-diacylglycerol--glycerol-3-phosphate 3-phosphatidyltransferase